MENDGVTFWEQFSDAVGPILDLFSILAIIVGSIWAYYHFWRGRTYKPRLETILDGLIIEKNNSFFLLATLTVTNVGLSKFTIQQYGTGLMLDRGLESGKLELDYQEIAVLEILTDHEWLEPGEPVAEELFLDLGTQDFVAFRGQVRIVSDTGQEWNTITYVVPEPPAPYPGVA